MSIKKNNKQISGNYTLLNLTNFRNEVQQYQQDITNLADEKKSELETINDVIIALASTVFELSVGSEKVWRGEVAPENYIFLDGQEISRDEYNELYNWAVQNNLIVTEEEWQSSKKYGLYSHGDGSTTFRVPKMTGYYLVGYDPSCHTALGVQEDDTLPNINGTLSLIGANNTYLSENSSASGVFSIKSKSVEAYPIIGSTTLTPNLVEQINFDLSQAFKTSDRVQPKSIPVKYIVCYRNAWDIA